jgi:hypothetical protein
MARFLQTIQPRFRVDASLALRGLMTWTVVWGLLSCSKVEEEPPIGKIPERPLMLFSDTTLLDFYEGKFLSWKLQTAWRERWGGEGRVFAKPIFVDIYDSLGMKVAFLRSDSGELDSRMSYVRAFGHVYALTPKGASVRADSLVWNKQENKVQTASYVRVVSEDGDVLQGKGFISDSRLENWQIQSNVTGIFQDAADRMKNEDEQTRSKMTADSVAMNLSCSSGGTSSSSSIPASSSSLAKGKGNKGSLSSSARGMPPRRFQMMPQTKPSHRGMP